MIRTVAQNRAAHAMLGDFARSWSHEGVHLTAADWKLVVCCYFHFALCEADGLEVRDIPLPESTSKMDVDRMNNFLEWLLFLGAHMDVIFTE